MPSGEGRMAAAGRRAAVLVVALSSGACAVAASASAQERTAAEYGGGSLPRVAWGSYTPTAGLAVRDLGGGGMRYRLTTSIRCLDAGVFEVAVHGIGSATPSAFNVSTRRRLRDYPRIRLVVRYRIALTFAGDRATGTVRINGTYQNRGRTRQCVTQPERQVLLTARGRAGGGPADPAPNGFYAGLIDRRSDTTRSPVVVRVNRTGRQVGSRWELKAPCTSGPAERLVNYTPATTIRRGRAVRRERFSIRYLGGFVVRYRPTFDARFRAGGVKGTVRLQATIRYRGRTVARCDSGPRTFSALPVSP